MQGAEGFIWIPCRWNEGQQGIRPQNLNSLCTAFLKEKRKASKGMRVTEYPTEMHCAFLLQVTVMVCIAEQRLSNLTFMNSSILGFTQEKTWKLSSGNVVSTERMLLELRKMDS